MSNSDTAQYVMDMQNIHKHPMVTASEAASALGIDSRTVREKLSTGEWKGEKRRVGLQDKWFMYRGELDRQLAKLQVGARERTSTQGIDGIFKADAGEQEAREEDIIDASPVDVQGEAMNSVPLDVVLAKITEQFSKQLTAEKEMIFALKRELDEKDRQLRLIPDLQKQAAQEREHAEKERKAAEVRALEIEALNKQIAAMEEQKRDLEEKANQASALADDIETLKATVQKLQRPWWQKMFSEQ